jgi:hypothetical protein
VWKRRLIWIKARRFGARFRSRQVVTCDPIR